MIIVSIAAIVMFIFSAISHAVADFVKQEGKGFIDYKTMAWFRAWGNVFNAIFWLLLFILIVSGAIKLIWGG